MLKLWKSKFGTISITIKSLETMVKNSFSNCKEAIAIEKVNYVNDNINRHALDVYIKNKIDDLKIELLEWLTSEIRYDIFAKLSINDININIIFS